MSRFEAAATHQNGSNHPSNQNYIAVKAQENDMNMVTFLVQSGLNISYKNKKIQIGFPKEVSQRSMAVHRQRVRSAEGVMKVEKIGRGMIVHVESKAVAFSPTINELAASALTLNDEIPSNTSIGGKLRQAIRGVEADNVPVFDTIKCDCQ